MGDRLEVSLCGRCSLSKIQLLTNCLWAIFLRCPCVVDSSSTVFFVYMGESSDIVGDTPVVVVGRESVKQLGQSEIVCRSHIKRFG